MVEVVEAELESLVGRLVLCLLSEAEVLLSHHADVLLAAEVVVLLEKDRVVFELIKVEDGLKIFLIKVFMLELLDDQVALLSFSKPRQKNIEIVLDLLCGLRVYLTGYALHIINVPPSKCFDKL